MGCKKWDINREWTGAILHGRLSPAVCTDKHNIMFRKVDWFIIGAETGKRKGRIIPQKAWVDKICEAADACKKPVFMKGSLRELMGDDFRQEFPWEV